MNKSPSDWQSIVRQRNGAVFNDLLAKGVTAFVSQHAFKTPLADPRWPEGSFTKLFGACQLSRWRKYRVSRLLFGYHVVFAVGKFLPAHAARLSDMCEAVFGKYRIEPARAKWNFSEESAKLDLEREPMLRDSLLEFEKVLLLKEVVPAADQMPEIRAVFAPDRLAVLRRAAKTPKRGSEQIMAERLAPFAGRLKTLEDAAEIRIGEIDESLAALKTDINNVQMTIPPLQRLVQLEERVEDLHQKLAKLSLSLTKSC